jgi:beta-mannosidase
MEPFEKYREKTGRFMSEYGFQSAPATGIWKGVVSNPSLTSKSLRSHQKHPKGFETIDHYLKQYFKVSDRLERLYLSFPVTAGVWDEDRYGCSPLRLSEKPG